MSFTLEQLRDELIRERDLRQKHFPDWVANGKLKKDVAEDRIAKIIQAIAVMDWLAKITADRVKASVAVMALAETKPHAAAMTLGLDDLKRVFAKYPNVASDLKDQVEGKGQ